MTPDRLSTELRAAAPEAGELVYVERRGDEYGWARGQMFQAAQLPDAWMYYTGQWPVDDDARWLAFFADFLAELDSMVGGPDRCRWSPDDPWPHGGIRP